MNHKRAHMISTECGRAVKLLKFVAVFAAGSTERQFVNLGLALDSSRFAVHFGCLRRWGHFLEEIDARGIPVLDYKVATFRSPERWQPNSGWRMTSDGTESISCNV
jgi:hypothetical protein